MNLPNKLTLLRSKDTCSKDFRNIVKEIAILMAYEVTRNFPLEEIEIETPIAKMKSKIVSGKTVAIVPILRAGLGMVDGVLEPEVEEFGLQLGLLLQELLGRHFMEFLCLHYPIFTG